MWTKIGLALAGLLAAVGLFAGLTLAVGLPGSAGADDPTPATPMHQACQAMAPDIECPMSGAMMDFGGPLHQGMMNPGGLGELPAGMYQACQQMDPNAMGPMHEGVMNAGGQMGQWMAAGDHCPWPQE